jgi:hypothetical protein
MTLTARMAMRPLAGPAPPLRPAGVASTAISVQEPAHSAARAARDGGGAPRRALRVPRAPPAPRLRAAGVPPFQPIGGIESEATVAPVTAAPARGPGGGAESATHRLRAEAERGRQGRPRPPAVVPRPPRRMGLDPAGPPLGCRLLPGRSRGWNGDGTGAVRQGHRLTTDGGMDGRARLVLRLAHRFAAFHQRLEQVKPRRDLGGFGGPVARPLGRGAGPIARDDRPPGWARSHGAKGSASRSGPTATGCRRATSIRTVPEVWPVRRATASTPKPRGVRAPARGRRRMKRRRR